MGGWQLWTLLGGNSFNSKSLGLLLDPNFSSTEAAQAAKIFEKPGPFTKMRVPWNQVATFFQNNCADTAIDEAARELKDKIAPR